MDVFKSANLRSPTVRHEQNEYIPLTYTWNLQGIRGPELGRDVRFTAGSFTHDKNFTPLISFTLEFKMTF